MPRPWEHIEQVLPKQAEERKRAETRLAALDRESAKLLQAFYADAIDVENLRVEQVRIATEKAVAQRLLSRTNLAEENLKTKLETCCALLSRSHEHYLAADDNQRRELNQAVFTKIHVFDEEIVGVDFTPTFGTMLSENPAERLLAEALRLTSPTGALEQIEATPARRPKVVTDRGSLAPRLADMARTDNRSLRERPHGNLPYERENRRPREGRRF